MSHTYSFYVEILDRNEKIKGRLTQAIRGNLTFNQSATVHSGGTVHAETLDNEIINTDPQSDRLRVYFQDNNVDTLMGTYLIAAPDEKYISGYRGPRTIVDYVLLDKITILDEFRYPRAFTVSKGANTVDTVVSIIAEATGESESRVVSTPSTRTLRESRVWDVGTTALKIVNDLLAGIDYSAVRCDPSGRFLVEPYTLPANRPVVYTFQDGHTAIHEDSWTRSRDIANIPNRFTVFSTGTETEPGYVGVATNTNINSPFSYQARGRWIDQAETATELASQSEANALASRRLNDVSNPVSTIQIQHAFKKFNLHDRIRLVWHDRNITATIWTMNINIGSAGLMTTGLREVL